MTEVKKDILWRLYLTFTFLVLAAFAIVGQIVRVQYVQGDHYRELAKETQIRNASIEAKRGNIYAQDGALLAASFPYYRIIMDPTVVKDALFRKGIDSLATGLSKILGDQSASYYKNKITNARRNGVKYVVLHKKASVPQYLAIRELPIFREGRFTGGLYTERLELRERPYGSLASRTVGIYRESNKVGLEGSYDSILSGVTGLQLQRKVAGGVWMPLNDENQIEPIDGLDIITTIDVNIQDITETALRRILVKNDAAWGTAVVMEVSTGKVRAISNLTRQSEGEYSEVLNYAVGQLVEPGSTFKLYSLLSLLEDGYVSINDSVDLNLGTITYSGQPMQDSEGEHHYRNVTVKEAFAKSSNVGISRLVAENYKNNKAQFVNRIEKIGLNKATGINIPGEPEPVFKMDPANRKEWSGITLPWMSVGYELQITPMQLLTFYNAIANDGKMMQPMLVEATSRYGKVEQTFKPVVLNSKICSDKTLEQLHICLEAVVDSGTAKNISNPYYKIGGKTGTAQQLVNSSYSTTSYLASFAGYFPADDPKYSCIVVVSEPSRMVFYGGYVAGPVFREIADKVYSHDLNIIDPINAHDTSYAGVHASAKGYSDDFRDILDWFNIDAPAGATAEWWNLDVQHDQAKASNVQLREQLMPSVKGMGLRDALYMLENMGLQVAVTGTGKVVYQSIQPGQSIYKGARVTLKLG
jgi:cell division protein FtsI (penicillin-binding protein 3)